MIVTGFGCLIVEGAVMEDDVSTRFHRASTIVWAGNPDEVTFRIFRVSKKMTGFAAGGKLGQVIG